MECAVECGSDWLWTGLVLAVLITAIAVNIWIETQLPAQHWLNALLGNGHRSRKDTEGSPWYDSDDGGCAGD